MDARDKNGGAKEGEEAVAADEAEERHHIRRRSADGLQGSLLDGGALAGCGPFLKRVVIAAEEARANDMLEDVFDRAYKLLVGSFAQLHTSDTVEVFIPDIASKVGRLIITEALSLHDHTRAATTLSSSSAAAAASLSSISAVEQNAWCRIGKLTLRLVREGVSGFFFPSTMDKKSKTMWSGGIGSPQQALALLQERIPWTCGANGANSVDAGPPMVSAFTLVWGCVFALLQLLANHTESMATMAEEEAEEEEEEEEERRDPDAADRNVVSSHLDKWHPLPQIVSDCVHIMVERNYCLFCEAQEANKGTLRQPDVLCVAANNFAWLQHHCMRLHMTASVKVKKLLGQCTACVLQDVVNGCIADLHQGLFSYIDFTTHARRRQRERQQQQQEEEEEEEEAKQYTMTFTALVTQLGVTRLFLSRLAPSLPRDEVVVRILEGLLRPVVEELFDGARDMCTLGRDDRTTSVWAFGNVLLPVGVSLFHDATAKNAGESDNMGATTTNAGDSTGGGAMHRLSEVLQLMESNAAFGPLLCQRSVSFRTLRRLLPTLST